MNSPDSSISRIALLTPPGPAAIAVVRLSGGLTAAFLAHHFSRPTPIGRAVYGRLADGDRLIDDAVVARLSETVADLSLHGNAVIVEQVMALAARSGFARLPQGACLPADRVDGDSEIDREALDAVPLAHSPRAWRTLLAQPAAWATLEAATPAIRASQKLALLGDRSLHWLLHPPTVALVGRPNAGKSTLANALAGDQQRLAGDQPGTTRDWIGAFVDIAGLTVRLIDTPGQRATIDPLEHRAIELSQPIIASADLVILVLDATRPGDAEQNERRRRFSDGIVVSNKCDAAPALPGTLAVSAETGMGLDAVRDAVLGAFDCADDDGVHRARIWTSRQKEVVENW